MRGEKLQVKSLIEALPLLKKLIHQDYWSVQICFEITHILLIQGIAFMIEDYVRQDHADRLLGGELTGDIGEGDEPRH